MVVTDFLNVRWAFFIERKAAESKPLKFRVFESDLCNDPEYEKNEKALKGQGAAWQMRQFNITANYSTWVMRYRIVES